MQVRKPSGFQLTPADFGSGKLTISSRDVMIASESCLCNLLSVETLYRCCGDCKSGNLLLSGKGLISGVLSLNILYGARHVAVRAHTRNAWEL